MFLKPKTYNFLAVWAARFVNTIKKKMTFAYTIAFTFNVQISQ